MKLLGVKNDKIALASISHYDCRSVDGLLVDGGQCCTQEYAGYTRMSGERCWFEVPQTFAELYNDYRFNSTPSGAVRKYGKWNLKDIRILSEDEYPDPESFEEKVKNTVWGTSGVNGDQPTRYVLLVDCVTDHLEKIRDLCVQRRNDEYVKVIDYILKERK